MRQVLGDTLRRLGVKEDSVADILLAASEACTNVIRHAGRLTGRAHRPNIVFVLTDDLSENLIAYMPQVQALENEGVTFDNQFVTDSVCCASCSGSVVIAAKPWLLLSSNCCTLALLVSPQSFRRTR